MVDGVGVAEEEADLELEEMVDSEVERAEEDDETEVEDERLAVVRLEDTIELKEVAAGTDGSGPKFCAELGLNMGMV